MTFRYRHFKKRSYYRFYKYLAVDCGGWGRIKNVRLLQEYSKTKEEYTCTFIYELYFTFTYTWSYILVHEINTVQRILPPSSSRTAYVRKACSLEPPHPLEKTTSSSIKVADIRFVVLSTWFVSATFTHTSLNVCAGRTRADWRFWWRERRRKIFGRDDKSEMVVYIHVG